MFKSFAQSEASARISGLKKVGKVYFFVAGTLISNRSNTGIERYCIYCAVQLSNCAKTTNNRAAKPDNRAAKLNNSADYPMI